jgi:hypothetical protein
MTIDALAPTPQRLARSKWLAPETSREVNRVAWRALDIFDRLLKSGELELDQWKGSRKFERHYYGALGIDVREGEGSAGDAVEFPRSYHAQKLAEMRHALTPRQYAGLVAVLEGELDMEGVGRQICRRSNAPQARTAGMILLQEALTSVAILHGFIARAHPPTRR